MNTIFEVNYAAFSIFASLLITEIMGAVVLLVAWPAKEKVLDYLVPIWEITGTFGAFWVVTGDFAYPGLLVPVASIFTPLLIAFLILWVARGSAISFAEFITKRGWLDEAKLYRAYSVATILLGMVVLVLLSSLVGGQGVDLTSGSFSISTWITPGSIVFVIGTLLLIVGLAPVFFDLQALRKLVLPLAVLGVALSVLSYFLMSSELLTGWMLVPVLLTLVPGILYALPQTSKVVANKAVFLLVLCIIIFSLQPLVYPKAIGLAIPIDAVTTAGAMADAFLSITAIGGLLLAVMLLIYIRVAAKGPSGPDLPSP
jgi:cytochrome bd ubiquinol oxidase subunit II